jgi:Ankyrin repeats (3 copies)/Ankyrin repeat
MLARDPKSRPSVFSLRALFDSYCVIWGPTFAQILEESVYFPFYLDWKGIVFFAQDQEPNYVIDCLVKWYRFINDTKILEPLLAEVMDRFVDGSAFCGYLEGLFMTQVFLPAPYMMHHESVVSTRSEELVRAVFNGDLWSASSLLINGADVNGNIGGYRALPAAAQRGHYDLVALLLRNGADVNATGPCGISALQFAAAIGDKDVVSLLWRNGADVNAEGIYGSALHIATSNGHVEVVSLLLEIGANVNALRKRFGTPLDAAIVKGRKTIQSMLLEKGARRSEEIGN